MPSQSKTSAVHKALRASEQQFQLLVQGVKDYAIFMLDPQGRITTWNSGAERILAEQPLQLAHLDPPRRLATAPVAYVR
jgi:PAS domain-containing protein